MEEVTKSTAGKPATEKDRLNLWLTSGDSFLEQLAADFKEQKYQPTEIEAAEFLTFLIVFSMGCATMGLEDLRKAYDRRASLYFAVLSVYGFDYKRQVQYWTKEGSFGGLTKVMTRACYNAGKQASDTCCCSRFKEVKEPVVKSKRG
jgi:hypothetical protein